MRRPCMSVNATTTVSISPAATWCARCSLVSKGLAPCLFAPARPGDEALEKRPRPGQVRGQLLRVTLHRNDKPVVGLHAFDRPVLPLRRLVQARREAADRLVVEAVDADLVLAGGMAQLRAGIDDLDGVREVAAPEAADVVVLQVLDERAAQRDVDHLLAPADAEEIGR